MARSRQAGAPSREGLRLLVLATLLAVGCAEERSPTAVVLQVGLPGGAARPQYLEVSWLSSERGHLRGRRVPKGGALPSADGPVLAEVAIEIDDARPSSRRRVVVVGFADGRPVAWGASYVDVQPGVWKQVPLSLRPGLIADEDSDGVPNDFDLCRGLDDFEGCATTSPDAMPPSADAIATANSADPVPLDAAVLDSAPSGPDGGARLDTAVMDARAPDATVPLMPDAGRDAGAPDRGLALPPSELMATATSASSVTLTWRDNAGDETGFRIDRGVGTGPLLQVAEVGANVTQFVDKDLMPTTFYTYRVLALPARELSSNTASATTDATAAETEIEGAPFGTVANGSGREFFRAFDGDLATYFEGKDNNCFVGLDAGRSFVPTKLRFAARMGYEARTVGGKFEGSKLGVTEGWEPLHLVQMAPAAGMRDVVLPAGTSAYRYFRYVGPASTSNARCMLAEFQVHTKKP